LAELAGKLNQVWALTGTTAMTNVTGAKVNSCDNSSYNRLVELLEVTHFGDNYRRRMAGLLDTSVPISGNYDPSDTGQGVLVPGASIFIGVYPQGTAAAGFQVQAIVESHEISADASGKQTFSASIQGIAAPVALPAR